VYEDYSHDLSFLSKVKEHIIKNITSIYYWNF